MSKYVIPTGPGYQGIARVDPTGSATLSPGMYDVDWPLGTELYAVGEAEGVALFASDARPAEFIHTYVVRRDASGAGPHVKLSGPVTRRLGVDTGEDIRVYRRDAGGLLVVPADGDPFVEEGGPRGASP